MAQQKKGKPKGLKIGQLAKLAGVPVPTVKHYLKEGLLPRPVKTGRTMCYYEEACVERVSLIKRLRMERFLPLGVIKRIIESGASLEGELAFSEALMSVSTLSSLPDVVSRKRIAKHIGYALEKIDRMEASWLIHPRMGPRGKEYDPADRRIISLMKQREEAGLPFDYSLQMMAMYRAHIQRIVKEDMKLFVRRMLGNTSAADAARYIREGDKALAAFMPLIKAKILSSNAETIIEGLNSAPGRLREAFRLHTLPEFTQEGSGALNPKSPLWLMFAGKHKGNKLIAKIFGASAAPSDLFEGAAALAAGEAEEALLCFTKPAGQGTRARLAHTLTGLAHVARISGVPGLISPMHIMTEAVAILHASRGKTADSDTGLLGSYLCGVGLAIVPEVFDTHQEAAAQLSAVIESKQVRDAAGGTSIEDMVRNEIGLKASYFLAQMYMDDEEFEAAREILISLQMRSGDSFYGKWAQKQLREANKRFRSGDLHGAHS